MMKKSDLKILLLSFYNGEAIGVRQLFCNSSATRSIPSSLRGHEVPEAISF